MEIIRGRKSFDLDLTGFLDRLSHYSHVALDLGTGDGRYVHHLARQDPHSFFIGVDSCRENLVEHSHAALQNMLFVIASAQELPHELYGRISQISINFPWGSLLHSLLNRDAALMEGLACIALADTKLYIRLNGGALAEAGFTLEDGAGVILANINDYGWRSALPSWLDAGALKHFPSTWAKRLAYGRDPRAMTIHGRRE